MNFNGVEAFLSIIENRSITGASKDLKLSQSTVSYRLNILENEIGKKLISRQKGINEVALTDYGEEFISIAKRWISLNKDIESFKSYEAKLSLSIGSEDNFCSLVISNAYRNAMNTLNNLHISIKTAQSDSLYQEVENGDLDVAFVKHRKESKELNIKMISSDSFVLVKRSNRKLSSKSINIENLDKSKEVYFSWSREYEVWHNLTLGDAYRVNIDSFQFLKEFLLDNDSWCIMPSIIAKKHFLESGFEIMKLNEQCLKIQCYRVCKKSNSPKKLKVINQFFELL